MRANRPALISTIPTVNAAAAEMVNIINRAATAQTDRYDATIFLSRMRLSFLGQGQLLLNLIAPTGPDRSGADQNKRGKRRAFGSRGIARRNLL